MSLFESLKVAWGGLSGNKLRSILTMLGVIIGVAAVIALVSIGQGATRQVTSQIQSLGSNMIMIMPRRNTSGRLFLEDTRALELRVPTIDRAVPSITLPGITVKWKDQKLDTTLEGTGPGYTEVRSFDVALGRFITEDDVSARRKVAVVGQKLFTDLFGEKSPLGEKILINGEQFTVVGLMEKKGQGIGGDYDDRVLVPVTAAQRIAGTNRISVIYAQARSAEEAPIAVSHIMNIYQHKFPTKDPGKDDLILVQSQDQLLSAISDATQTMTIMLGGIAGVSLLVGGIGIMNIMLVSVTERTREIGIRKALGAKKRDILAQFLVESVIISTTGGFIGILMGLGGSRLVAMAGLKAMVSMTSVGVAFGFALGVGLFFGIYPAMKAGNLDPIEALRYE